MSLVNLANTKARLLGCSAVYLVGQSLSTALSTSGPAATMAAGILGGPTGVLAASVLATIVTGVVGNITAGECGNKLAQRIGKNADILKNGDLTAAAGEAISRLLQKSIPESEEFKVIAERNGLRHAKADFQHLAKKTVAYWETIDAKTDGNTTPLNFSDSQLAKIFSPVPNQFVEVTGLSVQDWQDFLTVFAAKENKTLHPELIGYAAAQLHQFFPKAFCEVLKQDAATGGRQFAGMQLILHREAVAQLQNLGLQNGEILQKLQALATREQICQVMAKLEVVETIRDELAEVRALLQTYIDTSAPSLPLSLQCETIIQDRVKDFIGRLFVFEAISRFLRENRQGYFVLEAEPGVGKSSIMAKFVLTMERHCVTHFNSRSDGIIDAKTFLKNVCTQLIQGFKLKDKYPQLPDNATANNNFLVHLLKEVSVKVAPKKLIFVVDALDEVDMSSQTRDSNVLYLPDVLPANVYFIVSKRPENLPMPVNHLVFDLMQYNAESLADVKAYLAKRTEKSASIQSWINHRNLNREEFVTAVAQKSEKKFIYLRYVLDEIASGTYGDVSLNDLPRGLQQYYQKHWGQMMGRDDDPLLEMKVKIIYVLSKAREAVSRGWIAKSVGERDFEVQRVLRKWDSFLRQQQVDGEIRYSIYHNSFREFLEKDETVQSAGIDVEEVKRKGINNRIDGAPL
ncbi:MULTISPECIES: ATP-binding protein [unclassified Microcoleus]|uniref:ATP-binding protein n=1 Tax=unclassified Microcoleus TaxID=2642155 RepID=UPI001E07BAD4|nr:MULTISPECIES: ATP-binding protein [unclassified Microcoleus]MCC3474449.1 ATP-binding protein [Microcoleus sp. PH2017_13_LAR_U_A]MCC3486912.1 ATP-binding protein [Microcoleus sp. PH2017_14_LAR_D_A]MCC3565361.1 ATP-binding protein [Microcoleus sp. PH2017_31_RDM_U_A]MCC3577688.1 ATP-binding protein [Microcoleus sp. PH2017_32_RDM_D_A]MCC3592959.1 ATP-binding protein [Microcoleus sp. PH2017_28_MFU_U_A]